MKSTLEISYYGDARYAPVDLMADFTLQSIGDFISGINLNRMYWWGNGNTGFEFTTSKNLPLLLMDNACFFSTGYYCCDSFQRQYPVLNAMR